MNPGSLTQIPFLNHPLCYFSHLYAFPQSGRVPYDRTQRRTWVSGALVKLRASDGGQVEGKGIGRERSWVAGEWEDPPHGR